MSVVKRTGKSIERIAWCLVLLLATPVSLLSKETAIPITSVVSVSDPSTKIFLVRSEITDLGRKQLQLDWPAWTPGYATIWDYGQHVFNVVSEDENGKKLKTKKNSVNSWTIDAPNADHVIFEYHVRAMDPPENLGFAQAYLDSTQGWYNGAALFPEIAGYRDEPQLVKFELPEGWKVATAMLPVENGDGYTVQDYDELVDSPVQLGHFLRTDLTVADVPIAVVVSGSEEIDMNQLASMIAKIAEYQFQLMAGPNIDRYLFIYHAASKGAGGLEHLNATTISLRHEEYFKSDSWLPAVTAHELFHVWNAKRIHTERFNRYDYSGPNRSREVWFAEGITAYYAELTLHRIGLMSKEKLYSSLAQIMDLYENNPAHERLSWEEISWHIWDEEVRQGLGVWLLPGWMLDLKIRDLSDNRFSLDDVMRFLNLWFGEAGHGYEESGLGRICSAVVQHDLEDFFREHIAGHEPFPYQSLLGAAGLTWKTSAYEAPNLGCRLFWSIEGKVKAIGVEETGPAFAGGLRSGDIIISVNDEVYKNRQEIYEVQKSLKEGDLLKVIFHRGGEEMQTTIEVGSRTLIKSSIVEIENPTARQLEIRNGILQGRPR